MVNQGHMDQPCLYRRARLLERKSLLDKLMAGQVFHTKFTHINNDRGFHHSPPPLTGLKLGGLVEGRASIVEGLLTRQVQHFLWRPLIISKDVIVYNLDKRTCTSFGPDALRKFNRSTRASCHYKYRYENSFEAHMTANSMVSDFFKIRSPQATVMSRTLRNLRLGHATVAMGKRAIPRSKK
jgi:hypothetical protein